MSYSINVASEQMDKYCVTVPDIPAKEIVTGFKGRFVHSANMTVAYWEIRAGSVIPVHQHLHEMIVNVIERKLELTIGGDTEVLDRGVVGIIPSQAPHTAKAIADCIVLDVFHPVRSDYVFI